MCERYSKACTFLPQLKCRLPTIPKVLVQERTGAEAGEESGWLGNMDNIKQQRGLRVWEVAGLGRMPNPK